MTPGPEDALQPELSRVKKQLEEALTEVCSVDVERADTGELIRVEEVLAIANEAAKTAVSIRRRRSVRRHGSPGTPEPLEVPSDHRTFADEAGVQWEAFAVHPSANVRGRSRLPEPFRYGWLAFDSDREKRRLSPIPDGWASLSVESLRELCDRAERVRRRGRGEDEPPSHGTEDLPR